MNIPAILSFANIFWVACAVLIALRSDLRRRRLSVKRSTGWNLRNFLDVASVAITAGTLAALASLLLAAAIHEHAIPLNVGLTWRFAASAIGLIFLWSEGRHQIQFQRPDGLVFGEWLILSGAYPLFEILARHNEDGAIRGATLIEAFGGFAIVCGAAWIGIIIPQYLKRYEGLRIVDRINTQGEARQQEYVASTPECPHPEHWQMLDAQTAEVEVLDFLKTLVTTVKPSLIVETGTFIGHSAIRMAEGLKANGFGRIITVEYDPEIFAKAKQNIDASGLREWIEYRNQSSLETKIDGMIDILFSDSDVPIREAEIRRFLPQVVPNGLVLAHDASSQFKLVREAAIRLEQEGLLSVVLLSTPRGLMVAQKREGRK